MTEEAKRVPKANFEITVVSRDRQNRIKGTFIVTSGGIDYYRKGAKKVTKSITLQELGSVLDNMA